MQVKTFLLTLGAGMAAGAIGVMLLPKSSGVYQAADNAAQSLKNGAENVIDSMTKGS